MREFKFRAYDKITKQIHNVLAMSFEEQLVIINDIHVNLTVPFSGIELMQFTAFHDATKWEELTEEERAEWTRSGNMPSEWNGKEIFEDDILKADWGFTYVVEFYDGSFWVRDIADGGRNYMGGGRMASFKKIGNIHQHPELLKG